MGRIVRRLRVLLRCWLLRGPLLAWWIARRARQWEQAYCGQLLRPRTASSRSTAKAPFSIPGTVRSIVFIADCMWEQSDLVPELGKIAEVTVLDLRSRLSARRPSESERDVSCSAIKEFAAAKANLAPDLILLYARPALLSEEIFHSLRRQWHCPIFGMNLDDKLEFFPYRIFADEVDNYQHWAKCFDLNLTSCLAATAWYEENGLPCLYMPSGFHPRANVAPPDSAQYQYDIGFLGSRKPEREQILNRLVAAGVPLHLWGKGWPNSQWIEDSVRIFRSTQINLGIGFASPSLALTSVKARDFECPGAGACYLTTYNWELALHYDIGREILCYRSVEELIELYTFYRTRPEECLRIAQAAWRRCANEHTWEKRFRDVFRQVGLK